MPRGWVWTALAAVLAAAMASGCSRSGQSGQKSTSAAAPVVEMHALRYVPVRLNVVEGTTVTWKNTSMLPATVTADPAKAARASSVQVPAGASPFDSGEIRPGGTFQYTFHVCGQYRYFCASQESSGMIGEVAVSPRR